MSLTFAAPSDTDVPLDAVSAPDLAGWLTSLPAPARAWAAAQGFTAALGQAISFPAPDGGLQMAAIGMGTKATRGRGRFHLAGVASALPEGTNRLEG